VMRMLEKKPARRFQLPLEVAEELGEILGIPAVPSVGKAEMLAAVEAPKPAVSPSGRVTPDPAAGVRTFMAAPSDTPRPAAGAPPVTIVTSVAVQERESLAD